MLKNGWSRMAEWITESESETIALGYEIGKTLKENSVLCLFGDLGAGKTTFIKGIRAALAHAQEDTKVNSPTFVYLNIYEGVKNLYHFDLYRLRDAEGFISMGFDEYFHANGICCIEWSERIASLLPDDCLRIHFTHLGPERRCISLEMKHG
jgi:tRNA threonylcarbamoyladenosine biosynthesis protein TsaE